MADRNPPQNAVKIHFPCIHPGSGGGVFAVTCFESPELKGIVKVVLGIDDESARRVIGASRYSERDHRAGIGVMALFSNPLFSGRSYGLALAVADKLVRYEAVDPKRVIYATGEIPIDGGGRVDAVDCFFEKLKLLADTMPAESMLLFPQGNAASSQEEAALIDTCAARGVSCVGISHLDELEGVVWSSAPVPGYRQYALSLQNILTKRSSLKKAAGVFIAVFLFIALLLVAYYRPGGSSAGVEDVPSGPKTGDISPVRENSHQEIIKIPAGGSGAKEISTRPENRHLSAEMNRMKDKPAEPVLESVDVDSGPY